MSPSRLSPRLLPLLALLAIVPRPAHAVGEASTRFSVFVPPNNETISRAVCIAITALEGTATAPTLVDLVDDGTDGDTDDTQLAVPLVRGQTLVRYLKDGAINDDAGGKWDGDFFRVLATHPVLVMMATDSDWQHDFVPAENKTMRGTEFFVWVNRGSGSPRDLNVFSYEPGTRVTVRQVSTTTLLASGTTRVTPGVGTVLLDAELDEGEDLMVRRGLGVDALVDGHSYEITATRPVTVLYGALDALVVRSQARDGGAFVPSRNGASVGTDFVFTVPHDPSRRAEQEIRIVSFEADNHVTLEGALGPAGSFSLLLDQPLGLFGHADVVGPNTTLYRLKATKPTAVFEANWLETGSIGTSDFAAFASGSNGFGVAREFVTYLGPPGNQGNVVGVKGTFSHLFLFGHGGTATARITDADTGGTIVDQTLRVTSGSYAELRVDATTYALLNRSAQGIRPYLRVSSDRPISVLSSNANDNWLTYVPGVLVPAPLWEALDQDTDITFGDTQRYDATLFNPGGMLGDAAVGVVVPVGLTIVSATATLPDGSRQAAPRAVASVDGETTRIPLGDFATNARIAVQVEVRVSETATHGALLPVRLLGNGTTDGDFYETRWVFPVRAIDPRILDVSGLEAVGLGSSIRVQFETSGDATVTLLRSTSATGTYASVNGPTSTRAGLQAFGDTAVTAGSRYFYKVRTDDGLGHTAMFGPVSALAVDVDPPPVPVLTATGGDGVVNVTIGGTRPSDFDGVELQRTQQRLDAASGYTSLVARTLLTSWNDTLVRNGTTYGYKARARDVSGNWSNWSVPVSARPTAPADATTTTLLAYEDMAGLGENDWDYNDWIVRQQVRETFSADGVRRVETAYLPLARGAGYDHTFRHHQVVNGRWTLMIERFATPDALNPADVETLTGTDDVDVEVHASLRDALPGTAASPYANTDPAAPETRGAWVRLTLDLDPAQNPTATRDRTPFDPYLRRRWSTPVEIHVDRSGLPIREELNLREGPVVGRLLPFVLVRTTFDWPAEGEPVWRAFSEFQDFVNDGRPDEAQPVSAATWSERPSPHATWRARRAAGVTP